MTDDQMMDLLRQIADSLTDMVRWEADCPSKHPDGQITMLDLKVQLDVEDRQNPVKFRFYQKPVENKNIISAKSCMPSQMIFCTLVEEGCRRLRNTFPSLLLAERTQIL